MDSRQGLITGGDRGASIVPGDAAASLMIRAVRREGELAMPPNEPLSEREIRALTQWIQMGAPWPAASVPISASKETNAKEHWAFQPVRKPAVPQVSNKSWVRTPIDAFVLARLEQAGLAPSADANRRTLIRRASYTLTGLPPSADSVSSFVDDRDPQAYEHLVDRLLASPHYGEHWARHWLDVARYSDTKGYVYAREERFWTHAWAYRDWVVVALNDDLPYNRFLLLQLAADQAPNRKKSDLAAMGFLTLGRRFLGVQRDIIDDRIDVVCRGTMGLTVGCARCHDHKYDPIPTADYYSLYGVFDSCAERRVSLKDTSAGDEAFWTELQKRQEKLQTQLAAACEESPARARDRVADYLHAQTELEKYPADGFDQIFQKSDLLPAFVRRWEDYLRKAKHRQDSVFVPWRAYGDLPEDSFAQRVAEVTQRLRNLPEEAVNKIVAEAFATPPSSFQEVIQRYGAIFAEIDSRWKATVDEAAKSGSAPPVGLSDPAAEQLRRVLYGPQAPCEVPDEPIVHTESLFDSATCTALWKLQGQVDRWIIQSDVPVRFAVTLVDRPVARKPRIFRRGNPLDKGDEVPRRFLSLCSESEPEPFQHGSGRLELARAICDGANPLTARVMVNRVWMHHFGQGLVATPSDFGLRAGDSSHPKLLDWLAWRFVSEGWRLKKLHRWLLLSSTFRQSSTGPSDRDMVARAEKIDPGNRLLWRMNQRRLTFEELRDSVLAASGELDLRMGGKPVKIFQQPFPRRRTLYALVDRQFLPSTLRTFDFASPDLHISQRSETTVPQQALFLLNDPLVLERARALAKTAQAKTPEQTVRALFRRTCQREPTRAEIAESLELVRAVGEAPSPPVRDTAADWQYGYGAYDEANQCVKGFAALPHFTGAAWQGGEKWPDREFGWVQLTAAGGHPGNDRQHASVRRWIAPRAMTITLQSKLIHEPAAGDGIRAFIVSDRAGLLQSAKIHQQTVDLNVMSCAVKKGETIDFVVDIGDVLNSDQYLWTATISELAEDGNLTWNSEQDFPTDAAEQLTAWEQLAQVLLCSNEFLFVD